VNRPIVFLVAALATCGALVFGSSGAASAEGPNIWDHKSSLNNLPASGALEFADLIFGHAITECPQARLDKYGPLPLDRRTLDRVEQYSEGGDDRRTNEEYSCLPQNETSIDTNPVVEKNLVAGANDYRLGVGSSGVYASTDNGQKWYGAVIPFPSTPTAEQAIPSSGDPAVVFDRAGVVYYAQIVFNRDDDDNGVTVSRSTNGGFTWSRACVPQGPTGEPATDANAFCGAGPGDPRQPGDGVVSFWADNDNMANDSVPGEDKEYIAAGPRPAGIEPVCFTPVTRTPQPCDPSVVGVDRIYVTWTRFDLRTPPAFELNVYLSYSDDQGRSWSPPRAISGSASFCAFSFPGGNTCDFNQFSVPTVHPTTGELWVSFENFNTLFENQYLVVRNRQGGNPPDEGPYHVTPIFDVNYPMSGDATGGGHRKDCGLRGQQNFRNVLTNSCFRMNSGGNIVVDRRGGEFADDLYLVMADNRNGTPISSNSDVFLFRSTNGGVTWFGPTRVNNDRSEAPASRNCENPLLPPELAPPCPGVQDLGADQWWPWVDINRKGHLNIVFYDRRLDPASTAGEWPTSRAAPFGRPGNYLTWFWAAQCTVTRTALVEATTTQLPAGATQCTAPGAAVIVPPTGPFFFLDDPVPGSGAAFVGPLRNFGVSDVPSNMDYSFRAGIFAGDYNNVAVTPNNTKAYGFWTDTRNGRSSGGPGGSAAGGPSQPGRNPICEQADAMVDEYSTEGGTGGQDEPRPEDSLFLVTPCPAAATDSTP
jgi:hypothetical protein